MHWVLVHTLQKFQSNNVNKYCKYFLLFLGVSFWMEGMAQTKYQQPIVWREAGMLPTINNEQPNIGLSGIITGIIGGQLLIGGGNNFPAGLPWAQRPRSADAIRQADPVADRTGPAGIAGTDCAASPKRAHQGGVRVELFPAMHGWQLFCQLDPAWIYQSSTHW